MTMVDGAGEEPHPTTHVYKTPTVTTSAIAWCDQCGIVWEYEKTARLNARRHTARLGHETNVTATTTAVYRRLNRDER